VEIFGVVNASPDSLADFSVATTAETAEAYARQLLADGADHIDLGGQASHGGATFVTPDEEWAILEEPLRAIAALGVTVSVDTWQVETAERAFDAGASVLNAADALQDDAMLEFAAERECDVVLPFMLGPDPRHLKHVEGDPVEVMVSWFGERLKQMERFGIRERCYLDPGTGFAPADWTGRSAANISARSTAGLIDCASSVSRFMYRFLGSRPTTDSSCSTSRSDTMSTLPGRTIPRRCVRVTTP